jgi:hypothetical protein
MIASGSAPAGHLAKRDRAGRLARSQPLPLHSPRMEAPRQGRRLIIGPGSGEYDRFDVLPPYVRTARTGAGSAKTFLGMYRGGYRRYMEIRWLGEGSAAALDLR